MCAPIIRQLHTPGHKPERSRARMQNGISLTVAQVTHNQILIANYAL